MSRSLLKIADGLRHNGQDTTLGEIPDHLRDQDIPAAALRQQSPSGRRPRLLMCYVHHQSFARPKNPA
jgi:hypothetical protein